MITIWPLILLVITQAASQHTILQSKCDKIFQINECQLSASSEWDFNHGPANGNLHHKAGGGRTGAWSAKHNDVHQWMQADLEQISKITAVATQGRTDYNQWVKSYTLEYSLYGTAFQAYKEKHNYIAKVFKGNTDRNRVIIHKLSHPIFARYVRFRPKTWHGHVSMRMAVYGCTSGYQIPKAGKCGLPLGLESHGILDSQISASSEWNKAHGPSNARLHFRAGSGRTGAWSSKTNDVHQWLQVDFRNVARIGKVATQGRQDYAQWVTTYRLSYSQDGIFWNDLPVYTGNKGQHHVVSHKITPAIEARYVRIIPITWHGHISMRAEFYGCDTEIIAPAVSCRSMLSAKGQRLSASSEWDVNHGPANGNLHHKAGGGRTGAWSAKHNDVHQWLQADLGQIITITAVATQGRADYNQWVKTYTLEYSFHGTVFQAYKEYNAVKVFRGNDDRNTVVGHMLSHPIFARYVRFRPKTWHGHVSMRMAVYGCTSVDANAGKKLK